MLLIRKQWMLEIIRIHTEKRMRIRVQLVLAQKARVDFASALSTKLVSAQVKYCLNSCGEKILDRLGVDDDFIIIAGLQVGEHIGDLRSVMW